MRPARALRWCVLRSSAPPIDAAYRAFYRALVHASVALLRRCPGVASIYVCRGFAKGEIVPGLSDIDFMIIANSDADMPAIRRTFERIARWSLGRVEYYPKLVKTREQFEHRWRTAAIWQHRYLEGRSTWRLLHGADLLAALPPLSDTQKRAAFYQEMQRWWLLFAKHVLGDARERRDAVVARSICYKAVAELRNLRDALWSGELRTSRRLAFAGDDSPFARRLERLAESRFLARDDEIFDDTLRFLVDFFRELWGEFAQRPYLRVDARCAQALHDANGSEPMHSAEGSTSTHREVAGAVRKIEAHLEERWGDSFQGARLVRSAFWDFHDRLLLVTVDRARLPSVEEIAALVALLHELETAADASLRLHLFLRVGDLCFPLAPQMPRDFHRGILTPATMPDVFLQLGVAPVYWTDYAKWYLVDWRTNEQWPQPSVEKKQQLEAIARGYEEGSVVYPLTRDALNWRQLAAQR